ncbi:MAG: hypothetical protein C6W57_11300 [Caldibacillus debilis]|nr:MAG: hypothetical protein C6W57_11300 [Caldibacillus debilis]
MKCGKRNFPHDPPFLPAAFQEGKGREGKGAGKFRKTPGTGRRIPGADAGRPYSFGEQRPSSRKQQFQAQKK